MPGDGQTHQSVHFRRAEAGKNRVLFERVEKNSHYVMIIYHPGRFILTQRQDDLFVIQITIGIHYKKKES
jgi:hypothetical protein